MVAFRPVWLDPTHTWPPLLLLMDSARELPCERGEVAAVAIDAAGLAAQSRSDRSRERISEMEMADCPLELPLPAGAAVLSLSSSMTELVEAFASATADAAGSWKHVRSKKAVGQSQVSRKEKGLGHNT